MLNSYSSIKQLAMVDLFYSSGIRLSERCWLSRIIQTQLGICPCCKTGKLQPIDIVLPDTHEDAISWRRAKALNKFNRRGVLFTKKTCCESGKDSYCLKAGFSPKFSSSNQHERDIFRTPSNFMFHPTLKPQKPIPLMPLNLFKSDPKPCYFIP